MRAAADSLLASQFGEVVRLTEKPFFQPIYDLEMPRMAFGRIALLGDAAFVGQPHAGMGVTKAAGDAVSLTNALLATDHDVEQALKRFETARLPVGAAVIARARHLGAYMKAQISTEEERRMAETFRTPEAVMKETAVADFLPGGKCGGRALRPGHQLQDFAAAVSDVNLAGSILAERGDIANVAGGPFVE